MAISGTYSPRPSMRSTTVCAAIWPIRRSGCLTVVNGGLENAAPGVSSNPTTEISSGTRSPASWKAHRDPIAEMSLRSEEHTSELQSPYDLVCRLLLEKKKKKKI